MNPPNEYRKNFFRKTVRITGVIIITFIVLLAALLAAVHIPSIQSRLLRAAAARSASLTGSSIHFDSASINLFKGTIHIQGLKIEHPDHPSEVFVELAGVHIKVDPIALLHRKLRLKTIELDGPGISLLRDSEGRILHPFSTGHSPETSPELKSGNLTLPPVTIDRLNLQEGWVRIARADKDNPLIEASGISIQGSAGLKELLSSGSLGLKTLETSLAVPLKLDSPIQLSWHLPGDGSGTIDLSTAVSGMTLKAAARLMNLASQPEYTLDTRITGNTQRAMESTGLENLDTGTIDLTASARGDFSSQPDLNIELHGNQVSFSGWKASALHLTGEIKNGTLENTALHAETAGGTIDMTASGQVFPEPRDLESSLKIESVSLSESTEPLNLKVPLAGVVSADLKITAADLSPGNINAGLKLTVTPPSARDPSNPIAPALDLIAEFKQNTIVLKRMDLKEGSLTASANGYLHFREDRKHTFSAAMDLSAPDISRYLALAGLDGKGTIKADLKGEDSFSEPVASGSMILRDATINGMDIRNAGFAFAADRQTFRLDGIGLDALGFTGDLKAEGGLPWKSEKPSHPVELKLTNLMYKSEPLTDLATIASIEDTISIDLASGDQTLFVSVSIPPKDSPVAAQAIIDGFNLRVLAPFLPERFSDLEGTFSGFFDARLPEGNPDITGRITALKLATRGRHIELTEPADITYRNHIILLSRLDLQSDESSRVSVSGSLNPVEKTADAHLTARFPDLSGWNHVTGMDLKGSMDGDLSLSGSYLFPTMAGYLLCSGVRYQDFLVEDFRVDFGPLPGPSASRGQVSIEGFLLADRRFPDISFTLNLDPDGIHLEGGILENQIGLTAGLDMQKDLSVDARLDFNKLDLGTVAEIFIPGSGISGKLAGMLTVRGPLARPEEINAMFEASDLTVGLQEYGIRNKNPIRIRVDDMIVAIDSIEMEGEDLAARISGSLPFKAPLQDRSVDLLISTGLNAFLPLIPALDRLEGNAEAAISITGSLMDPHPAGDIRILRTALDGPTLPAPVEKFNSIIRWTSDRIDLEQTGGDFSGGHFEVTGGAGMNGLTPKAVDLKLRARELDIHYSSDLRIQTSADLMLTGIYPDLTAGGTVKVAQADYTPSVDFIGILQKLIKSKPVPAPETGDPGSEPPLKINLDLSLTAPENVRIENPFIQLDLDTRLQVLGSTRMPGVLGQVVLKSGYINLMRADFEVSRGIVQFVEPYTLDPGIDITATTVKNNEEITLRLTGTASKLNMELTSESGLTHEEILRLLLGTPAPGASDDTPLSDLLKQYALQSAASALADRYGALTGFEIVPFPSTSSGEDFFVSIGKRVGDRIVITYYIAADNSRGDAVELEIDLSESTGLKLRQNQDDTISTGFTFTYRFH